MGKRRESRARRSALRLACLLLAVSVASLSEIAISGEAAPDPPESSSSCPDEGGSHTFNFEGIEIDTAAQFLEDLTGKRFVVEGARRVHFDFVAHGVTLDEAKEQMLAAARQLGCEVIETYDLVRIIKSPRDTVRQQCPVMTCKCDDGFERTGRFRRGDDCVDPNEGCPLACKEKGGWEKGQWSLWEPPPLLRATSEADGPLVR